MTRPATTGSYGQDVRARSARQAGSTRGPVRGGHTAIVAHRRNWIWASREADGANGADGAATTRPASPSTTAPGDRRRPSRPALRHALTAQENHGPFRYKSISFR